MDDLPFRSLTALSRLLATRAASSRDIVKACLARIEAYDAKLHAFVEVYGDAALAAADAADLERRAGWVRGPLHGLPIALKDLLHVKGRATSGGSPTSGCASASSGRPTPRNHPPARRRPSRRRGKR